MKAATVLFGLAGLGLLVSLFLLMQPDSEPLPAAPAPVIAAPAPAAPAPPAPPAPVVQIYRVEKGQRVAGPELIQVRQDDEVTLSITSDVADELHMHGYDHHLHLHAGQPAELKFTATHSGRFEFELHKSHLSLGVLEVQPK